MERQRLRQTETEQFKCLDDDLIGNVVVATEEEAVITPPKDFQDHLVDSCMKITSASNTIEQQQRSSLSSVVVSGAGMETILEPPAMFRPPSTSSVASRLRPRTELFWSTEHTGWPTTNEATASQLFSQELERLKSHSLFLRFPLDGAHARVHYRSSKSVVVQSSSVNQYR